MFVLDIAVLAAFVFVYGYGWFFMPHWAVSNIWYNEERLKKYLQKHYVTVSVAKKMLKTQTNFFYLPIIAIQISAYLLVILVFMRVYCNVRDSFIEHGYITLIYLSVFFGILFVYVKEKKFYSLIDEEKIKYIVENKTILPVSISIANDCSLSKSYYYFVFIITAVSSIISLLHFKTSAIVFILFGVIAVFMLYTVDRKPINYMFAKDNAVWEKFWIKQRNNIALVILLNNVFYGYLMFAYVIR